MSTLDTRVTALLAKPSLEGLAYALEHPETWPAAYAKAGFHFMNCETCAMGLASALWKECRFSEFPSETSYNIMARGFGISPRTATKLFGYRHFSNDAKPQDVARGIRAYLANHPHASHGGDAVVGSDAA